MKPSGKTPYEIRLDLLQLAFDILIHKHKAEGSVDSPLSSPTTEEVIAEADKLNTFVSKASQ